MTASAFIHLRVTQETKLRLRALAQREGRTESAVLKQLLGVMLRSVDDEVLSETRRDAAGIRQARLTVRLQTSDHVLLRDRAAARAMPAATYVSVGGAAPVRAGLTMVKDARKVGRLGEGLSRWAGRSTSPRTCGDPIASDLIVSVPDSGHASANA